MEIKECESSSIIVDKMKQKLEEIKDKIVSCYKNELIVYNYKFEYHSQHLAEIILTKQRLFLIINNDQEELRDIFKVSFYNRELVITVTDPSEFIHLLETNSQNLLRRTRIV